MTQSNSVLDIFDYSSFLRGNDETTIVESQQEINALLQAKYFCERWRSLCDRPTNIRVGEMVQF